MDSIRRIGPDEFPRLLAESPKPPKELYVRGALPDENLVYLTIVGARRYTDYGREVCESLIAGLAGLPVVIVSGLAYGIDSIAHRAALKHGIKTVAVPGSGISDAALYPRAHMNLAREIIERGGAVLSPFGPEVRAADWTFPTRNAVMAGLSNAVLIIEAEKKSGTLITAKYATDYNRDVLTVPGSIFSKNSEGPHMLIRLGATPVGSAEELREALGFQAAPEAAGRDYSGLSPEEQRVVAILSAPATRDDLLDRLGMEVEAASALISILEIKGVIRETLGEFRLV